MTRTADGTFVAIKAGPSTLLATTSTGEALDFAVVDVAEPARLDFQQAGSSFERNARKVSLRKGVTTRLSAVVYDAFDVELAGDIAYAFASDATDVVAIDPVDERTADLSPRATGSAKLTVDGAGLRREIQIEVTP